MLDSNTVPNSGVAPPSSPAKMDTPSVPAEQSSRARTILSSIAVVVFLVLLAGWGIATGWRFPKFSELTHTATNVSDDWCVTHGVPASKCIECKPELLPKDKDFGWCEDHGVHNCLLEHPEQAQIAHSAAVSPQNLAQVRAALSLRDRPQNNSRATAYTRRIQFSSESAMEKAGVEVDPVEEQAITEELLASGEITYDQTRVAHLSSRLPGTVWRVMADVGKTVKKGDVLALVDAAELGKAKVALLQSIVQVNLRQSTYDRLQSIQESVAGRSIIEAKSALAGAQVELLSAQQALANLGLSLNMSSLAGLPEAEIAQRLQLAGLPAELADSLRADTNTTNLLPITAPFEGVVLERDVVAGEVIDSQKVLFVIADPQRMWLTLRIPQEDAQYVRTGQEVHFQADGAKPGVVGKVAWISTTIDEKTRTVEVRAEVTGDSGGLRARAFGTGKIILRKQETAIVIPNEALHTDGLSQLVFVRDKNFFQKDAPKFFHVRSVRPGVRLGDSTEIIVGLMPGEVIATKGSGVLLAQLQKSSLGAGCCGND